MRIPVNEIMSISCQTESWPHNPHLPKWMKGWGGATQIVIRTIHPDVLAELPVSKKHGRGRLVVDWGDREAAQQLVDSIVRPTVLPQARPVWGGRHLRPDERAAEAVGIRMKVLSPALGLFLSGMVGVLVSFVWAAYHTSRIFAEGLGSVHPVMALWAFPVLAGAVLQCIGAKRMLTLQSYMWAVMTAIFTLLPWSPGWIIGLPCGIWALVVLSKPEVMAAFLRDRRGLGVALPETPEPPSPGPGRFGAFFRSVGRYCLTAFSGRHAAMPSAEAASKDGWITPTHRPSHRRQ